jgi:maltose O-acetyltransferase
VGSERERMLAGELYDPGVPELTAARARARELTGRYNTTANHERDLRTEILRDLLGQLGEKVWIEPPFYCDYGDNIALADRVYLNFGCVVLDCARVEIGARTLLGPSVQVYPATHPVDPEERARGLELARPVTIGADVWIGGAAVIGPGVTIGDGSIVGAGSVVVADVPPRTVVAGNPARELRRV